MNSDASYSQTYSTAGQMTKNNSVSLTLSGYDECKITGLTVKMKSNSKGGAGNLSFNSGNQEIGEIATSAFNTANWHGSWSTEYVDINVSCEETIVGTGEDVVLLIQATTNSLYFQSATITYQEVLQSTTPCSIIELTGKPSGSIEIGNKVQFGYTALDENAEDWTGEVKYTSSDTNVATIDEDGLLTALSAGTTTISVQDKDKNSDADSYVVTVLPDPERINLPSGNYEVIIDSSGKAAGEEYVSGELEIIEKSGSGAERIWYKTIGVNYTDVNKSLKYDEFDLASTTGKIEFTNNSNATIRKVIVDYYRYENAELYVADNKVTGVNKGTEGGIDQTYSIVKVYENLNSNVFTIKNDSTQYSQSIYSIKIDMGVPYTLEFNTDGGNGINPISLYAGDNIYDAVKEIEPEKTNYLFGGWYIDENCDHKLDEDDVLSENTTLYAKWNDQSSVEYQNDVNSIVSKMNLSYGYNYTVVGDITDTLNRNTTGITGSSYADWSDKKVSSSAVYAGKSAGGNESIQLRSSGSDSGIVTTTSGGKVKNISIDWNSSTASGRKVDVYGKNTAYTSAKELYNATSQGDKIGSIEYGTSTELTIEGNYEYIGIRSNSGALYLNNLSITWDQPDTYTNCSFVLGAGITEQSFNSLVHKTEITSYGIKVSTDEDEQTPVELPVERLGSGVKYSTILLGDIINNQQRKDVKFTITPYIVIGGEKYYSENNQNIKSLSVYELVEEYHLNKDKLLSEEQIEMVNELYVALGGTL